VEHLVRAAADVQAARVIPFHFNDLPQSRVAFSHEPGMRSKFLGKTKGQMMKSVRRIWAVGALLSLAGCGTMMNMPAPCHGPEHPFRIYGGVRNDLEIAQSNFESMPKASTQERIAKAQGCALLALDLPLSAAADTITLPLTIPFSIARLIQEQEKTKSLSSPSNEKQ
jgi:uncharacterized protein YceK